MPSNRTNKQAALPARRPPSPSVQSPARAPPKIPAPPSLALEHLPEQARAAAITAVEKHSADLLQALEQARAVAHDSARRHILAVKCAAQKRTAELRAALVSLDECAEASKGRVLDAVNAAMRDARNMVMRGGDATVARGGQRSKTSKRGVEKRRDVVYRRRATRGGK